MGGAAGLAPDVWYPDGEWSLGRRGVALSQEKQIGYCLSATVAARALLRHLPREGEAEGPAREH